jgi:hypothetical protein
MRTRRATEARWKRRRAEAAAKFGELGGEVEVVGGARVARVEQDQRERIFSSSSSSPRSRNVSGISVQAVAGRDGAGEAGSAA